MIHNGDKFLPKGLEEREVFAIILNMSVGGASIKTNIMVQRQAIFTLHIPNVAYLESFQVKSEIITVLKSLESRPLRPRYVLGLKFIDPQVSIIKAFIKANQAEPKARE